jgi:hypothetical protein
VTIAEACTRAVALAQAVSRIYGAGAVAISRSPLFEATYFALLASASNFWHFILAKAYRSAMISTR